MVVFLAAAAVDNSLLAARDPPSHPLCKERAARSIDARQSFRVSFLKKLSETAPLI
jgi:hypothetical protein